MIYFDFVSWLTAYGLNIALPLFATFVISFLIGFERQNSGKSAGISPHVLVAISSCALALMQLVIDEKPGSTQRVIAQVVSGIGFLGAGVIMKSDNRVKGLTTAATLWTSSVIGIILGMRLYEIGLTLGVFVVAFMYIRDIHRQVNPFKDQTSDACHKKEHNDLK